MIFMLFKPLGNVLLICLDLFIPLAQRTLCLMKFLLIPQFLNFLNIER